MRLEVRIQYEGSARVFLIAPEAGRDWFAFLTSELLEELKNREPGKYCVVIGMLNASIEQLEP